jgi:hypothetical protein
MVPPSIRAAMRSTYKPHTDTRKGRFVPQKEEQEGERSIDRLKSASRPCVLDGAESEKRARGVGGMGTTRLVSCWAQLVSVLVRFTHHNVQWQHVVPFCFRQPPSSAEPID